MSGFLKRFRRIIYILLLLSGGLYFVHKSFVRISPGTKALVWTKFFGVKNKIYKQGLHFIPLRALPYVFKMVTRPEIEKVVSIYKEELPYAHLLSSVSQWHIGFELRVDYAMRDSIYFTMFYKQSYSDFKDELNGKLSRFVKNYLLLEVIEKRIIKQKEMLSRETLKKDILDKAYAYLLKEFGDKLQIKNIDVYIDNLPDIKAYLSRYEEVKITSNLEMRKFIKKLIELEYTKKLDNIKQEALIKRLLRYDELRKKGHDILPYLFLKNLSDKTKVILVPYTKNGVKLNSAIDDLIRRERQMSNNRGGR